MNLTESERQPIDIPWGNGPSDIYGAHPLPNLVVNRVSLDYRVPVSRGLFKPARYRTVHAVKPLTFIAGEGEFIGLVGRNGAGKSSLLRMIAGLEAPTAGQIFASSKPALIGVSAALNPQLTGYENIELGCLAMGLKKSEIELARERIIELAGLEEALERPMKTYSSGMSSRLSFSIMLANRPRIMLIDEALATGDAASSERYKNAMDDLLDRAGTVFLVSHAAQTIENMCTRALWIDAGEFVMDGDAREVARKYRWFAHNLAQGKEGKAAKLLDDARREGRAGYVKNTE